MQVWANPCAEQVIRGVSGVRVCGQKRGGLGYRGRLVSSWLVKGLAICAFAGVFFTPSLLAQQQTNAPNGPPPGWPITNPDPGHGHALPDAMSGPQPPDSANNDESCSLWAVAGVQGATVNAATLQVPGKARDEYRKGCSDLQGKKLANAEDHLRKAVQQYPKYAAAWILLGQVLEEGNRAADARDACSQASSVDPDYVLAYLCLADVAAQQKDWNQTLDLANRALALDPAHSVYGCFYSAIAQFHLSQLPAAEKDALNAIDADHLHRVPQAHLLLAQIYMAKHDTNDAAAQLRAYLKVAPNSPVSAGVRKSLGELESQTTK
jgi:tetratricopeptide (TPR) repeat protein